MKIQVKILITLLLGTMVSVSPGESVIRKGGKWNPTHRRTSTEKAQEFTGKILSTEDEGGKENPGIQLKLATSTGTLLVHVGPRWILDENNFKFNNGEPITVVGFTFSLQGHDEVLASEIRRGDTKIQLPPPEKRGVADQSGRDR